MVVEGIAAFLVFHYEGDVSFYNLCKKAFKV